MKITAAVTRSVNAKFTIEELELGEPGFGQVLIKVHSCGICHTDEIVRIGVIPSPMPIVLGHEASGVVMALGPGVTDFEVGDHVGASFASCGLCENCCDGKIYGCEDFNTLNFGGTTNDGSTVLSKDGETVYSFFGQAGFASHAIVDTRNLCKVDKDIDLGLVGPLGCGVQTGVGAVLNRLQPKPASSIAVFGCGTVGLSAIMGAKIAGCTTIIAVDINPMKLDCALKLGATHVFNAAEIEDTSKAIKELMNKELGINGVHYSIDTSGNLKSIYNALSCTKFCGVTAVLGAAGDLSINILHDILIEAKSLIGIVEGDSVPKSFIPALIRYHKNGQLPLDKLITYFDLKDIQQGFDEAHRHVKCVVRMP